MPLVSMYLCTFIQYNRRTMTDELNLEDILRLNPHLDAEEIQRMLKRLGDSTASPQPRRRGTVPDRLVVGDPSRPRKVTLRYSL